ncbi:unnamed protein product [Paramecium octaurelia]|uniref:Uncharacterized protein n=1 Tax=Paramecium octaurelia TaxID=43137 RepID=A0A8S1X5J3_PAROT|nr:unnamed protein product [Paramecium octaurelia]
MSEEGMREQSLNQSGISIQNQIDKKFKKGTKLPNEGLNQLIEENLLNTDRMKNHEIQGLDEESVTRDIQNVTPQAAIDNDDPMDISKPRIYQYIPTIKINSLMQQRINQRDKNL